MRRGIGLEIVVHTRRAVHQGRLEVDHHVQRLEVDEHVTYAVLGDVAALRDHDRQRFADVAHLVAGERQVRPCVKHRAGNRRWWNEERRRRQVVAEIGGRIHRDDARPLTRGARVDRDDARVRVLAPDERGMQHPRQLHVVHEARPAGQQAGVFVPRDTRAKVAVFCWQR
jgi:hypothetical protein